MVMALVLQVEWRNLRDLRGLVMRSLLLRVLVLVLRSRKVRVRPIIMVMDMVLVLRGWRSRLVFSRLGGRSLLGQGSLEWVVCK
jgi:hypothetical protein